jgi:hypothetical protein
MDSNSACKNYQLRLTHQWYGMLQVMTEAYYHDLTIEREESRFIVENII